MGKIKIRVTRAHRCAYPGAPFPSNSERRFTGETLTMKFQFEENVRKSEEFSACVELMKGNEPFSTAERSERVENFLFRALLREYTEAGIEQAIVAMRRLGANSPEPRKRAVRE